METKNETGRMRLGYFTPIPGLPGPGRKTDETELWLVREDRTGWTALVGTNEKPLVAEWPYRWFGALCSGLALEVEDATRRVGAKALRAEDYLTLWRETPVESVTAKASQGWRYAVTVRRAATAIDAKLSQRAEKADELGQRYRALLDHRSRKRLGDANEWTFDMLNAEEFALRGALRGIYLDGIKDGQYGDGDETAIVIAPAGEAR